ncbi:capsular polysaccharide synthesis protein [Bifidobacterium myosotis]|uniref:Polysaccharide biosynthesis protein n=1 Tax=Bifidobacterium myosotis TaxID=1630166 RepID=A0A5M9ZG42_9BIFI|nr:capsular polysaccharide synthesis protein [Bifidobacterium myosotis]KAA8825673.1 hypothetical protein EMO91_11980 [Bifidobacterium myosotis]
MNRVEKIVGYGRHVSLGFAIKAIEGVVDERIHRATGRPYTRSIYQRKDAMFQKFLYKEFGDFIDQWKQREETSRPYKLQSQAPIWVLWLQGERSLPALVKENIEALRRYSHHPVILVDANNISDYVDIPQRYFDLFKEGRISAAAFSDVIRIYLLWRNGGLWVDSSVRVTNSLPEEIFDLPLWTIKGIDGDFLLEPKCIDITRWTGYFLAAKPHSLFFTFLKEFYDLYFTRYDEVLDYLLINHFAKIARENIAVVAQEYELIPDNNYFCEMLLAALNSENMELVRKYIDSSTFAFKLSNRDATAQVIGDETKVSAIINQVRQQGNK